MTSRSLALIFLLLLSIASASGITSRALFTADSTFKQAITIAVPIGLMGVLVSRRPLLTLTAIAVVLVPLDLVVTAGGLGISPLDFVVAIAWPVAYLTADRTGRRNTSRVGWASLIAAIAITIPFVNSSSQGEFAHLFVVCGVLGYLVAREAADRQGRVFLLRALVVSATIQAAAALYEVGTGKLLNLYSSSGAAKPDSTYFFSFDNTFRPAGTLPDPIALGNVLSAGLVLSIAAVLSARSIKQQLAWAASGLVIATGLIFTLSRLSWIGAVVGIAVLLLTLPRRRALVVLGGIVAGTVLVIAIALAANGKALVDRYKSISNPTSATNQTAEGDKTRLEIWHAAFKIAETHPVAGIGFGHIADGLYGKVEQAGIGTHAHSTYLNTFAEGGLLGLGSLLLIIGATLMDGVSQLKRNGALASGVLGAFVAFLVDWTTDYTVRNISVAAFVAAVIGLAAMPGRKHAGGLDA